MAPPLPSDPSTERAYFFDAGLRFECTGCGACCTGAPGQVLVGSREAEAISAHLGINPNEFYRRFTRPVPDGTSLTEHANGDCVFLEGGRCSIHAVKPVQCGTFPFWAGNLRSESAWAATVRRCEGIGRGRLYDRAEILALLHQERVRTEPS